jgi:hypothetical protein
LLKLQPHLLFVEGKRLLYVDWALGLSQAEDEQLQGFADRFVTPCLQALRRQWRRRCKRENVIAGPSMPWPKLDPRDSRFAGRRYGQP